MDREREVEKLAASLGVKIRRFTDSHWRLQGVVTVDYWPRTSKAWEVGSPQKGLQMPPHDVVAWVATGIRT